ncbi:hypothetical protein ACFL1H_03895 [Nanoarchaeota archaeon]
MNVITHRGMSEMDKTDTRFNSYIAKNIDTIYQIKEDPNLQEFVVNWERENSKYKDEVFKNIQGANYNIKRINFKENDLDERIDLAIELLETAVETIDQSENGHYKQFYSDLIESIYDIDLYMKFLEGTVIQDKFEDLVDYSTKVLEKKGYN